MSDGEWVPAFKKELGAHLKGLRKRAKYTQVQAAKRAGIAQPALSDMERGIKAPGPVILAQLARAYGVTLPEMLPDYDLSELND